MNRYSIRTIDSLEGVHALREDWSSLLSSSSVDTVFLTWEWMSAWAEHYIDDPKKLFVLVLKRKNTVIGIAPWFINTVRYGPFRLRRLEFIGNHGVGSDYLDVIAAPGREKESADVFFQYLVSDKPHQWDCLAFRGIPADSLFFSNFLYRFQQDGMYIRVTPGSYCPSVNLPADRDQFLASMRPHRRSQYHRHLRMVQRDEGVQYEIANHLHRNEHLREFLSFYEAIWGRTSERYRRFLDAFIERVSHMNWVEVESFRNGDAYVAGILHLIYGKTKYSYLTAVDKEFNRRISIGNVLICLALQDAIRRNLKNYNFLKGAEPYKYHWANSGEQLLDIYFQKRKMVSALQFAGDALKNAGKIILR